MKRTKKKTNLNITDILTVIQKKKLKRLKEYMKKG